MAAGPQWRTATWYAKPDDLIGGWCVGLDDTAPSEGGTHIGDFLGEDIARHIVALHNQAITGEAEPVALA